MPDRIYGVTWNGAEKQSYTYDGLGRLTNRQLKPSASITLNHSYTYADAAGNKTTSLVETLTTAAGTYTYTYDAAGNILSISDGAYLLSYQYDGLNRLIRENDERAGKTYTYEYAQGNITKKKEYAYTTGTVSGTPLNVTEWEYGNAEWGDLLTNWNGQPLEYDSIGNLTAFGTEGAARRELFWNGRQLKSIRLGQGAAATNILYEYNSDGLRISRTATDADEQAAVTKYIYNGDILAGEIRDDGKSLLFYYDNNGQPFGLRYNGTDYYYLRNLQNDVAAIADGTGAIAARYYYDAWGNLLSVTDGAGHAVTDAEHIGLVNPIRYRGYYYDSDTGYYWLNSRYYDPVVGRYLNADSVIAGVGGSIQGYNMFAYCFNNPVNMSDSSGHWPQWIKDAANWVNNNIVQPVANFFSPKTNTISGQFQDGIFRGSGSLTGGYSEFNGRLQVNSKDSKNNGMLGGYGKVSVGNASGKIGIGNDNAALSLKGVGDALTATAQAGIQYKNGAGLAAKAKASVLSGRTTAELELFGWQIEFGVSGDLLSVGAEAMIGVFPDEGFTAKASVGAGLFGGGFVFRVKPKQ